MMHHMVTINSLKFCRLVDVLPWLYNGRITDLSIDHVMEGGELEVNSIYYTASIIARAAENIRTEMMSTWTKVIYREYPEGNYIAFWDGDVQCQTFAMPVNPDPVTNVKEWTREAFDLVIKEIDING